MAEVAVEAVAAGLEEAHPRPKLELLLGQVVVVVAEVVVDTHLRTDMAMVDRVQ